MRTRLFCASPGLVRTISTLGFYQGVQIGNEASKVRLKFVVSDPSNPVLGDGTYFLRIFRRNTHDVEVARDVFSCLLGGCVGLVGREFC